MKAIKRFSVIIVALLMVLSTLTLSAGAGSISDILGKKQSAETEVSFSGNRQCYYSKPYIFDICWNISDKTAGSYNRKNVAVSDKSTITVWYADGLKNRMNNRGVDVALADVLERIRTENSKMTKPMVMGIKNVGNASPQSLIKQYYKSGSLAYFNSVFPIVDSKTQRMFLKKAYDDENAAFFSICLDNFDGNSVEKYVEKYAAKAYDDGSAAFFSICLDNFDGNSVDKYVEKYAAKAYDDGSAAFFSICLDHFDGNSVEKYAAKAYDDGSAAFFSICLDHFDGNSVEKYVEKYAAKAYDDDKLAFFSMCFDYLDSSAVEKFVKKYAEKAYGDNRLSFFSILAYEMSDEQLEFWFDRSSKDGRASFKALCECDDYDDFFDWDNDFTVMDEDTIREYAKYGVTVKDGNFYYNGDAVRCLLYFQQFDSYNLSTAEINPKGNTDIKIVCDKNGDITGVESLTADEIEEFFGDIGN